MKSEAQKAMAVYDERICCLSEKYIGKAALAQMAGLAGRDKKRWYCEQLRALAAGARSYMIRCIACKDGSPKWHEYNQKWQDLELLLDDLQMVLIDL